ncbi:MAG TPA: hypothetical protein VKU41_14750 [Polyangiaceae bacterium]|nr:hypothetical protein [Polyangiaceae bacterium]
MSASPIPTPTDAGSVSVGVAIDNGGTPNGAPRSLFMLKDEVIDAYDIAFDAENAYVIGFNPGQTQEVPERMPLYGRCPLVLARMPRSDQGSVSIDDECVYWAHSEGVFSLSLTSVDTFQQ